MACLLASIGTGEPESVISNMNSKWKKLPDL
jgi:hypothetical protein